MPVSADGKRWPAECSLALGLLAGLLTLAACSGPAASAELAGKRFADTYEQGGATLALRGLGLKEVLVFDVLVAGLYLPDGVASDAALSDVAKRIEVAYFQSIPAAKLSRETRRRMQLNCTAEEFAAIRARVDAMDATFVDIAPGDRYALTYVPGQGTTFAHNGRVVGNIAGADFAHALFAVWVGKYPVQTRLREALLNNGR